MSVDAAALNLGQYALMSNDPRIAKIVYSLLQVGTVLEDIPIVTNPSLNLRGVRWQSNLPSVNWRKLNASSTVTSGTPTAYAEQAFILSNNIDTDVKLIIDKNQISDPRTVQVNAYLTGARYDVNDKFINNNPVTGNSDSFTGIRYRLDNPTIYGTNSACKISGGAVDRSDSGITATTAGNFCQLVEQMFDELGSPNGDGIVLYMNRNLRRRFHRAVRMMGAGGGFDMTKDAFDRRIEMFRNARVQTVGVKADQSTEIITNTEDTAGADGSSTYTSMYAVKYGEGFARGWQMAPLGINDIGVRSDEPTQYRVNVDWAVGLVFEHTRSIARVYDIKVA